jgi:Flp pilus assembly pilin Flp
MMKMLINLARPKDERGATIVEFAMVIPILAAILAGLFDLSHTLYVKSILEGAMTQAGRASSLEGVNSEAAEDAIDDKVEAAVNKVLGHADYNFTRKAYQDYTQVAAVAEEFADSGSPGDGECNNGETFVDSNGDGHWTDDASRIGQGGAKDAVVYEVTVTYRALLPVAGIFGWDSTKKMSAKTILKNQPFSAQATPSLGTCP